MVVVRDPVHRFLSAFVHRVMDLQELDACYIGTEARRLGVPINPDIHQFIDFFNIYYGISSRIRHHFAPQSAYVGPSLDAYTNTYKIEELEALREMLEREKGLKIDFPKTQSSSIDVPVNEISVREVNWIRSTYAGDYAVLRRYYDFDASLKARRSVTLKKRTASSDVTLKTIIPALNLCTNTPQKVSNGFLIYVECVPEV